MGRGRSSSSGSRGFSSSGGRGRSSWDTSSSRGRSSMRSSNRTTVIIGGGGYHHGRHSHGGGTASPVVGIVIGTFFALVGFILMIPGIIQCAQVFKYAKTTAVCVDNEYSYGYYYTLYDYTVNGEKYDNIRSNQGWEFKEEIGETVTIYYLKSDPTEISEERPASFGDGIGQLTFGLIFGGIGVVVMVICIKYHKNSKEALSSADNTTQAPVKEETHITCPYCGSRYSKDLNSCPKCGAGK